VISEATLSTVGQVFAVLAVLVAAFWLAHAAWSTARERREARRRTEVLRALAASLQTGNTSAAVARLETLGRHQALNVLVEMAMTVAGTQRERLDELAREWGVLDRAARWARSRTWARRLRAARLISMFGTGAETFGDSLLRDANPDVRAQAAEWAGAHPDPARISRLIEMLGDDEMRARFAAREALIDAGPAAIVGLATAVESAQGTALPGVLEAARNVAVPDFLPGAIGRMRSSDPEVRSRAAELAAAVGGPEAVRALELLAEDADPEVRAAAAASLGHLGHWQAASSVAALVGDPNWRTRRAAALSLRRMGPTGELLLQRFSRAEGAPADTARSALELPPAAAAVEEEERLP
jgi:HEAT repeat protein